MDPYCTLILLWLFSLRCLQHASALDKVRKQLGAGRASLGSLSDLVAIFNPEPLKQIAVKHPRPAGHHPLRMAPFSAGGFTRVLKACSVSTRVHAASSTEFPHFHLKNS
jgi:hypothetical protein